MLSTKLHGGRGKNLCSLLCAPIVTLLLWSTLIALQSTNMARCTPRLVENQPLGLASAARICHADRSPGHCRRLNAMAKVRNQGSRHYFVNLCTLIGGCIQVGVASTLLPASVTAVMCNCAGVLSGNDWQASEIRLFPWVAQVNLLLRSCRRGFPLRDFGK